MKLDRWIVPILFRPALLPAIFDGRKTQTRRISKPQPILVGNTWTWPGDGRDSKASWAAFIRDPGRAMAHLCPYGAPGDRMWVKEAWQYYDWDEDGRPKIRYRLDGATKWRDPPEEWSDRTGDIWAKLSDPANYDIDGHARDRRWRSPMFMPRWASRLTLEIVNVRVEWAQDISEDDARAEGLRGNAGGPWGCEGLIEDYGDLFDSINGASTWDANPWVWAITFQKTLPMREKLSRQARLPTPKFERSDL